MFMLPKNIYICRMAEKKRYVKTCLDNQLACYPHPKYHHLTVAYARTQLLSKSEIVSTILKDFFETKMNEMQRGNLMRLYESMTPEERKHPHKTYE